MRRYRLPYWAFVPTLGVWPNATDRAGAGTAGALGKAGAVTATVPLSQSGAVAVNVEDGEVTVEDGRPERPAANAVAVANPSPKRRRPTVRQQHPNTPSVGGPSWLRKTTVAVTSTVAPPAAVEPARNATARPVTRIYLKPSARAKAGAGGVALSNPISTAVVRRGDTVSIEYMPDALAEAGEGGVAISRPELIIQLVD